MDTLIQWVKVLIEFVKCIPISIKCYVIAALDYILQILLYVPRQVFSLFIKGFIALFSEIPVPDFITQAHGSIQNALTLTGYFSSVVHVKDGLMIIGSAYILKFIIRRIPVVG